MKKNEKNRKNRKNQKKPKKNEKKQKKILKMYTLFTKIYEFDLSAFKAIQFPNQFVEHFSFLCRFHKQIQWIKRSLKIGNQ